MWKHLNTRLIRRFLTLQFQEALLLIVSVWKSNVPWRLLVYSGASPLHTVLQLHPNLLDCQLFIKTWYHNGHTYPQIPIMLLLHVQHASRRFCSHCNIFIENTCGWTNIGAALPFYASCFSTDTNSVSLSTKVSKVLLLLNRNECVIRYRRQLHQSCHFSHGMKTALGSIWVNFKSCLHLLS